MIKKLLVILLMILIFSVSAFSQEKENLPVISEISELKNFTKVYIKAESTDAYKSIKKELSKNKALEVVANPDDAEFFLEYKVLDKQEKPGMLDGKNYEERGEMKAYFFRDEKTILAWSDTETYYVAGGMITSRPNEINLTRNFLKALKKTK